MKIYIDWGDKWLSSFDDRVTPLACRRNWSVVGAKFPLCIAFLTASLNVENDATVCIGLFCIVLFIGKISESVDDFVVEENNADDDEVFVCSDKCFILENSVQRFGISVDGLGAKEKIFF